MFCSYHSFVCYFHVFIEIVPYDKNIYIERIIPQIFDAQYDTESKVTGGFPHKQENLIKSVTFQLVWLLFVI